MLLEVVLPPPAVGGLIRFNFPARSSYSLSATYLKDFNEVYPGIFVVDANNIKHPPFGIPESGSVICFGDIEAKALITIFVSWDTSMACIRGNNGTEWKNLI